MMDFTGAKQWATQFFADNNIIVGDHDDVLLQEALTHKSFAADHPHDAIFHNERLEFLGDALLGAIVAELLRKNYPELSEADLTLKKIYLIKEPTLAKAARDIGLGNWIRLGKGEEKSGGREKDAILADSCEAWIAYLSLHFGPQVARCFIEECIYPYHEDSAAIRGKSYKSLLQERVQKTYQELPVYLEEVGTVETSGNVLSYISRVYVQDKLLAQATAGNKRKAQEEAARIAYSLIEAKME